MDGNDISGLSTAVLKDRRILADNGLVAVIIAIDSKENKLLARPVIVSRGFVFIKDSQSLIKEAEFIVANSLTERMKERTTFSDIKNCIRSTLEPFLYKKTRRNPIVIPVILNSPTDHGRTQKTPGAADRSQPETAQIRQTGRAAKDHTAPRRPRRRPQENQTAASQKTVGKKKTDSE